MHYKYVVYPARVSFRVGRWRVFLDLVKQRSAETSPFCRLFSSFMHECSRALMGERVPELLEHLDSRGLPPEVLVCDFMMSLGCRALPPTSLLRCFDLLFWEGRDTLQYIALAVLRHAEVST